MSRSISEKFGWFVRQRREAKEISLRQMAKGIGVSPAYLSQVERGQCAPPTEDKVTAIAKILDLDVHNLLAVAGKVSSDVTQIIKDYPPFAEVLLGTRGLSDDQKTESLKEFAAAMKKMRIPNTN